MNDPGGQALERSGLNNIMSILGGFQGPREVRFKGTIFQYVFSAYSYFGLFISHYLIICCYLTPVFIRDMSFKDTMFFAVPVITTTFSIARIYYMAWNRPRFIKLLEMNEEASEDDYYKDELEGEIQKWCSRARILQPAVYFAVSAPIVPWGVTPIINEILGNPWGPRRVTIISWYPYDVMESRFWLLTVLIQTMAGFHATLSNVMFDAVFICISLRQLALLTHLKTSFTKIFQVIHVDLRGNVWYSNYKDEAVKEKAEIEHDLTQRLKNWIQKHQTTMRLLNELQSLYSFPIFLHFCYVGMVLATGAATLIAGGLTLMEYNFIGMHLIGLSFTLFVICRIGDYIKIKTDEITEGLYGQNYFMLSKQQHTLIKTLLTAIKQPFVLRVAQAFPLSTETFKSVMTTTYSFFAMFTQMQHKN